MWAQFIFFFGSISFSFTFHFNLSMHRLFVCLSAFVCSHVFPQKNKSKHDVWNHLPGLLRPNAEETIHVFRNPSEKEGSTKWRREHDRRCKKQNTEATQFHGSVNGCSSMWREGKDDDNGLSHFHETELLLCFVSCIFRHVLAYFLCSLLFRLDCGKCGIVSSAFRLNKPGKWFQTSHLDFFFGVGSHVNTHKSRQTDKRTMHLRD